MVVQQHISIGRILLSGLIRRPRWWFALALSALVASGVGLGCSDDDQHAVVNHPVLSCTTKVSFKATGPVQSLYVSGSFNDWSETADRMTDPDGDGTYSAELSLGPGEYPYKFILNGNWILDPGNSYTIWDGGVEDSKLTVLDCHVPQLEIRSAETHFSADQDKGSIDIDIQYIDGADQAGPDPDSMTASLDGAPTSLTFDDDTWIMQIRIQDLEPDKYHVTVDAADLAGHDATELWMPFWIEKEPFSWQDAVIYFVFTDRFRDGDPSNDAPASGVDPKANYDGGDYAGVLQALQDGYFDRLGVTALWLSPPQANSDDGYPGADGRLYTGYHGYWPSRPRQTQPRFGTMDELAAVTAEAHKHGIRVLADAVLNHVHIEHPYYKEHAQDGWFHGDGSCVCGRQGCDWETHKIDCWFAEYTPDLNYENPAVVNQMTDDMLWWVRRADFDGLRCDAVKHMRQVAITTLASRLEDTYEPIGGRFYLVGETFTGEDGRFEIADFIGPHKLDGQFDFPMYWAMLDTFARYGRTMSDLDAAVKANEGFYPKDTVNSPFLGNHDVPRLFSHANGDIADLWGNGSKDQGWNDPPGPNSSMEPYQRVLLAMTFLLTMPGAPLIYYGDEIGMPGAGDPDNRRMMRFGSDLTANEQTLLEGVQRLGAIRKDVRALRRGSRTTLTVSADAYVFARQDPDNGQVAVVAINRAQAPWSGTVYLPAELGLDEGSVLDDRIGGGTVTVAGGAVEIHLDAMEGAIYVSKAQ
ncbi:MAG: glycosyl hydrolase [Deltaproteobacteria bacterium]|nr:glycosyl hydrolase [Deltaproteobacteria bacterium]